MEAAPPPLANARQPAKKFSFLLKGKENFLAGFCS